DFHVTGVQTCALPILILIQILLHYYNKEDFVHNMQFQSFLEVFFASLLVFQPILFPILLFLLCQSIHWFSELLLGASFRWLHGRSEERRVGNEWSWCW